MLKFSAALIGFAALSCAGFASAGPVDWAKVDAALGKSGAIQTDGVHKYGLPRSDLNVTLDGVAIKPSFALGGWVAFDAMPNDTMVMGDLVLTDTEVNPVMESLLESGIEVTALHNHLLRASPATFYMHIEGHGDAVKLASALHTALALSKTPFTPAPPPPANPPTLDLDTAKLDAAVGAKGKNNGGVYQFSVPRHDPVSAGGMVVPVSMGMANAINFQPTGGGKAAVTGDFVLTDDEVSPVIHTLRANGIEITAIHSHMLHEQPRLYFIHFWANDDAVKLAKALRLALEKTSI